MTSADIAPILSSKCLSCHRGGGSAPDLERGVAALAPFVTPGEARRSPLIWHLMGRATTRPWDPEHVRATAKPWPAGVPSLTTPEIRAFAEWIDLGGRP